ncbi:hypothetical protein HC931_22050 [Candidatus Gracilibacteria bacterium]|nr:hypothetical protein [Candidatus Gracilibacteria bacterium]
MNHEIESVQLVMTGHDVQCEAKSLREHLVRTTENLRSALLLPRKAIANQIDLLHSKRTVSSNQLLVMR